MEQRHQAVLAVIRDGVPIVEVARLFEVSRPSTDVAPGWSGEWPRAQVPLYHGDTLKTGRLAGTPGGVSPSPREEMRYKGPPETAILCVLPPCIHPHAAPRRPFP
jgi:hypothetical protein